MRGFPQSHTETYTHSVNKLLNWLQQPRNQFSRAKKKTMSKSQKKRGSKADDDDIANFNLRCTKRKT